MFKWAAHVDMKHNTSKKHMYVCLHMHNAHVCMLAHIICWAHIYDHWEYVSRILPKSKNPKTSWGWCASKNLYIIVCSLSVLRIVQNGHSDCLYTSCLDTSARQAVIWRERVLRVWEEKEEDMSPLSWVRGRMHGPEEETLARGSLLVHFL